MNKSGHPPPPVLGALDDEEGADALLTLEPETWEEMLKGAILWGRGKQKKLLQTAKNAGYVRFRRKWRAKFWTPRKRAHRGVMKEGGGTDPTYPHEPRYRYI